MRKLLLILLTAALLPIVTKPSFAAATLKANWQAGQQLVYDTNIDGDLNLQIPASAHSVIAGMPLEISLRGVGKTTLNTLKVSDLGDGTVQTKINPLTLQLDTFGQKAIIRVKDGAAVMTLNDAPQKGSLIDWNLVSNPPVAFTFSPQMKVTNITPTNQANATATTSSAMPTGMLAMVQNLMLQSLPAVLPTKSVNVGDKWTSDVEFKTSPAPDAAVIKLGSFQSELKDPQTIAGRSLQHITIHGDIDLTSGQSKSVIAGSAATLTNADDTSGNASASSSKLFSSMLGNHLFNLGQTVDGDLYFDAATGQFIQVDLNIDSEMQSFPSMDGPSTADGFLNFKGTIRFKLSQVLKSAIVQ